MSRKKLGRVCLKRRKAGSEQKMFCTERVKEADGQRLFCIKREKEAYEQKSFCIKREKEASEQKETRKSLPGEKKSREWAEVVLHRESERSV